ncbi:sensor histidine kinase [Eisenbergiella porci]|uniref:sensor histidine kinase n=1 Tax=Eisenbergiella porci TaxID=2652274 RepID=UPI002A825E67|nr:HAMP domain-containing sensor histidine kinase [Eisenbergiella porci]
MIKKIKSSLWLKIFLLLTVLLFAVSFLLYGLVMAVMPASYKSLVTSSYMEQITELADGLEGRTLNEASGKIYEFGLSHNAAVKLQGEDGTISFGEEDEMDSNSKDTIAVELMLADGVYILTVSTSPGTVNQITQTFRRLLPVIGIVILAISLMASYFVSRFLTKPMIEISNISKRLTALDMTWRCDTDRTDEIGVLACNLNSMAAHLDKALAELTEANEKLQADIELERQQEKMRVDFFRAVSHELKTPITILKGELEGMIYQVGEYKDREAHLRQSLRTVNEMELLVKEILAASRMGGNDFSLTISKVDLSQLIRNSCHTWQGVAEDKGQQFFVEIDAQKFYQGDAVLLQKAISNIISNAITYSPEHETVSVTFRDGELRIENSGVSIAADDLKHIFEPFYRGDASRNSKTGGSGLGLYIVKTIFERHNLNYRIESASDYVCFTVSF